MPTQISKDLLDKLGHNKLHKVDSLKIELLEISDTSIEIRVSLDVKQIGVFPLSPFKTTDRVKLTKGDMIIFKTTNDFKIKQRIKIT